MPLLDNGSWVPIILTNLEGSDNASWQAYLNKLWNCDQMENVREMFIEHICMLLAVIFTALVGFVTLPTTWRFSRGTSARSGYLILFHTAITELYVQIRLRLIPYLEYFNGHVPRIAFPFAFADSFILQMAIARDWLVTVLAFNRSMAVLYPLKYKILFGRQRTTKIFILLGYLLMAVEAIIMDWRPWYWKFDCIYLKAKNLLPLGDFEGIIPDGITGFYMAYLYPLKGYVHICIYAITIAKLILGNFLDQIKSGNISINNQHEMEAQRTSLKLFIICFLMVVPNVGYILLFQFVTRILPWSQMDPTTNQLITLLYKPLGLATFAAQPFLLFSMSKQFRQAVMADLRKWKDWCLAKLIAALMALTSGGNGPHHGNITNVVTPMPIWINNNSTNNQFSTNNLDNRTRGN